MLPVEAHSTVWKEKVDPLNPKLSVFVLPYDHYGTHLDDQRGATDLDLEKRNFAFAGSTLAEIWSKIGVYAMRLLQWLNILTEYNKQISVPVLMFLLVFIWIPQLELRYIIISYYNIFHTVIQEYE